VRPGQPLRVPSTPAGARPGATPTPPAESPRSRRSVLAIAAPIVAVLIVLGVAAYLILSGGSDDNGSSGSKAKTTAAAKPAGQAAAPGTTTTAKAVPLKPANIRTAVLNGTTTPGLARGVANRLQGAGFRIGTVTNAADQSRSATLVEFAPNQRRAALLVAKAIDVAADAVQPASAGSRAIAGESALVIVTVGADQNQQPQQ
jgi:hypothetical protein